jgi:hypothetical protein
MLRQFFVFSLHFSVERVFSHMYFYLLFFLSNDRFAFGIVMREQNNVIKRDVTTINVQLYNASTKASVAALVRSCGTTELRKAASMWKTTVLSSLILLKEYFNNRN